ncbi:unnamed protein product [Pylaiella littoralis]
MDRTTRTSSSGRRRNVVKPGRIDTILGHDRQGLRLNFGLAMHQQRSYTVAASRSASGGGGDGGGSGHRGSTRGEATTNADSSEPLTHSGSLSQSQGAYSHGMFPSQGMSLSQGSVGPLGHQQSQSETAGFGMSQPSPDILAPYASTHHSHDGGGFGGGRPTLRGVSGADGARNGGREPQPAQSLRSASSAGNTGHRGVNDSRLTSSVASAKARRPQPLPRDVERRRGQAQRPSSQSSRSGKGVDVTEGGAGTTAASSTSRKGFGSETAAVQAFERLLSEQFRTQVMSELSGLRTLVETTREAFADQTESNSKISVASLELQQELQTTNNVVRATRDGSSKALQLLETTVPNAFQSLETRLRRTEQTLAGVTEMVAATLASTKEVVAASTAAASAACAAAASMSEALALGKKDSRSINSGRLEGAPQLSLQSDQQQQQQRPNVEQHRPHQLESKSKYVPKPTGLSATGGHQQRQPGSRKREGDGQQQEHQHPSPAMHHALHPPQGQQRSSPGLDAWHSPQRVDCGRGEGDESWQGAEESLRWTQPWGRTATTAPGTSTAGAVTPHPGHQARRRGAHSSVGCNTPAFGGSSAASISRSSPCDPKTSNEMAAGAEEVDIPSSSLSPARPQQELDSYNPFHEEDLVSIAVVSSGINIPKNVSSPPPSVQNTGSTRPGFVVQQQLAAGAAGGLPFASSSQPSIKSRTSGRQTSRSPSFFSSSTPMPSSASSPGATGTTSAASRSSHETTTRAEAEQGATSGGRENCDGRGGASATTPLLARGQGDVVSLSPWPKPPSSPASSVRSHPQRPSVSRAIGAASGNGQRHRDEQQSTPKAPSVQLLAPPSLDTSPSRTSHSGPPEDNPIHAGVRGTPVLENGTRAASRPPPVFSPSRAGDEDEEEDSFGGPGLTVEAYMAKRHSSCGGSTRKNATSTKREATGAADPDGVSAPTEIPGAAPLTRATARRRQTAPTPSSVAGNSRGGGKRARTGTGERESNGDSWLVGGGSGW